VNGELDEKMTYKIEVGESLIFCKRTVLIIYQYGCKQSAEDCDMNLILHDDCFDCFPNDYSQE